MLAAVRSATLVGVDGQPVTVEVHVPRGCPSYTVVGLPDTAVRESRERVRARAPLLGPVVAAAAHHRQPRTGRRAQDRLGVGLAVALGLLAAADELPAGALDGIAVLGELGLDGSVRGCPARSRSSTCGVDGRRDGRRPCRERCGGGTGGRRAVRCARSLGELRACLKGEHDWPDYEPAPVADDDGTDDDPVDLRDVRGLGFACRALEVAAADATTSSSSGHPAPARRCWRVGPGRSCRPSTTTRRSRSRGSTRLRATPRVDGSSPPSRSARTPHRLHGSARGRRQWATPPGRSHARGSWHPVPRRTRESGPSALDAPGSAPRRTGRAHLAAPGHARVPCRLPARRVHEPVPVRTRRPSVLLQRCATSARPAAALVAVPRPLRPAGPRHRAGAARRSRRAVRHRAGTSRHGARPSRRRAATGRGPRTRCGRRAPPSGSCPRGEAREAWYSLVEERLLTGRGARGSVGWHARWPTSTASPTSPPPTWRARRCCGATCREAHHLQAARSAARS